MEEDEVRAIWGLECVWGSEIEKWKRVKPTRVGELESVGTKGRRIWRERVCV